MIGDTFSCSRCGLDAAVGHGRTHAGRRICRDCLDEINARPLLTALHTYADGYDPSVIDREQLAQWPAARRVRLSRNVAVLDLETTHLDERCGAITEIAVILCNGHLDPIERVHLRVEEHRGAILHPRALEMTARGRYESRADWVRSGAVPIATALARAGRLLDQAALCAHHLWFDAPWLMRAYERAPAGTPGRDWVLSRDWRRSSIDTKQLALPLAAQGLCLDDRSRPRPTTSLRHVYRYLIGRELEDHHDAMADAQACLDIARRLLGGAE